MNGRDEGRAMTNEDHDQLALDFWVTANAELRLAFECYAGTCLQRRPELLTPLGEEDVALMGWAWVEAPAMHPKRMKRTMKQIDVGAPPSLSDEDQAFVGAALARMQEYARLVALGEGR